ncbi:MAG TPA: hypothetical protein ENJ65_06170, partial [Candidatus Tenderia electrophaga]|nr:hypothetical protein [Candidatus Tenderia electrophaga]
MNKSIIATAFAALVAFAPISQLQAADLPVKTVEQVFAQQTALSGQRIQISGEVVKVNNGIMGKNFLHIQDGTGSEGSNDIIVTSQQTAHLGDKVNIDALVTTNRDF